MKRTPLLPPLALLAVFLGPVLVAAVAYYGDWNWASAAHGELIDPPLPLPSTALTPPGGGAARSDAFRQRWSLLYARSTPCQAGCAEQLERLGAVRHALARDRERVQLVFLLSGSPPPLPPHPALLVGRLDDATGRAIAALLGRDELRDGRVYIVDPRGNLVMSHAADAERKAILEDLKRLLRTSKIG